MNTSGSELSAINMKPNIFIVLLGTLSKNDRFHSAPFLLKSLLKLTVLGT